MQNKVIPIIYLFYMLIVCSIHIPKDNMFLSVFNIGQGDSVYMSIDGISLLIDGGPSYDVDYYINNIFRYKKCKFDLVVLTHPHLDHLVGLDRVIKHCDFDKFIFNFIPEVSKYADNLYLNIPKEKLLSVDAGDVLTYKNLKIYILWPPKNYQDPNINNHSVVMLVDYFDKEALLLGDIEVDALKQIDFTPYRHIINGRLEVYKVSHHGSDNGTSLDVLSLLRPVYCVISVGKENVYNHPSPITLQNLSRVGCIIKRTDIDSNIEFLL